MKRNEDIIAIYSRKSKFTGKGESIGNQVELCKEYIRYIFIKQNPTLTVENIFYSFFV